jgi:hypothetical protein
VAARRLLALAACVCAAWPAAPAESAPTRVVDRTFRCTLAPLYPGVRELEIATSPRGSQGSGGASSDVSTGYVSVGSGPGASSFDDLVFVRSRLEERVAGPPWQPGAYVDVRRCARTRASVPLSAKGLPGPPVRFDKDSDCELRGRIFVRLRAVLEAPTPWGRAAQPYFGARRNIVQATLAVRSERTRRPVARLDLDAAGKTRLWVSPSCT